MIGKTISHYTILEKLGGGGMGVVYKARDLKLDRFVALKFLPPELTRSTEARDRFIAEAKAVSSLQHANICTIHDIEESDEGQMFIVMDYYEGETLNRLVEGGPLPEDDALDIAIQVGRGLTEAHRHNVIHRDIKPANIMITSSGGAEILDFGLAKLVAGSTRTKAGTMMGTAAYMSPEQLQGNQVDSRSDIWSLGVVLYQMLTGERPFRSEYEPGLAYAILNTEPVAANTLNEAVSDGAVEIVRRALAKDPARRFESMEEMVAELVLLRGKVPGVKMGELIRLKWGVKRFRRKVAATAAGAVIILLLIVLGPWLYDFFFPPPPHSIAVLSCENQTGESSYDKLRFIVTDALTTKLEQFKDLKVTTQDRLLQLAKRTGQGTIDTVDNIAVLTPELGMELCEMEGVEAALLPRITKVDNLFLTHVRVVDVKTKRRITGASAQGLGVESILSSQIDHVVLSVALRLGLGPEEDEPSPRRLADITTSSLDAYSHFLMAGEMSSQFLLNDARLYLLKAIECDSTFALAYGELGELEGQLGYTAASREAFSKARALSYRASEKEQLFIEERAIRWEEDFSQSALEKRIRIQRTILEKYPEEEGALFDLAWSLRELGRNDEAVGILERLLEINPENTGALNQLGWIYALHRKDFEGAIQYFRRNEQINPRPAGAVGSIGAILLMMGRLDEALATMKRSYELDPSYTTGLNIGYVYVLREDYSEGYRWVESQIAHAASPSLKALGHLWKGYLDLWCGRLESAEASVRRCRTMADRVGNEKLSARGEWLRGWIELERGSYRNAHACFDSWRAILSPGEACKGFSLYMDGLLDLYEGRVDSARMRVALLEKHVAEGESRERDVEHSMLGLLVKEQLLRDGSPGVAASYPVSIPRFETLVPPTITRPFGPGDRGPLLSVVYMRTGDVTARAYAVQGNIARAIQEYESLVAPDSMRKLWIPPLYYYRMARLYESAGARDKASIYYEKFLHIWGRGTGDREEWKDAQRRVRNLNVEG